MPPSSLPLFALPWIVAKEVLSFMKSYELFALSTQSERSKRIVKKFSERRQFEMLVNLGGVNRLTIWEHGENDMFRIQMYEEAGGQNYSGTLKIDRNVISAGFSRDTIFLGVADRVKIFTSLIEHCVNTFRFAGVGSFWGLSKNENLPINIYRSVKNLKLNFQYFKDSKNRYDYDEIEELMGFKKIDLLNTKVSDLELKHLFISWINDNTCEFLRMECYREDYAPKFSKFSKRKSRKSPKLPMVIGVGIHWNLSEMMEESAL